MAYSFTTNAIPSNSPDAMFRFKEALKSAGWTVKSSSDGSTYNATGDQITTSSSGAGGINNTRSWFRIQQPGSIARELTIQNTTAGTSWRVKYSTSAGFTGGSPAATVTPTATDEQVIYGSGTDASPSGATLFSSSGSSRLNVAVGGIAENYSFYMISTALGSSNPNAIFYFDVLQPFSIASEDQDPCVMYISSSTTPTLITESSNAVRGWLKKGLSGEGFVNIPACAYYSGSNTIVAPNALGTHPINQVEILIPVIYMRKSSLSSPTGYKGVSTLLKFCSRAKDQNLTALTVSTINDYIQFDTVALPWDGSKPAI